MKMQSNERGQTIAVLAAGMFLVLLGFIGMAIDVGFLYHQKRVDQQAADAAALACRPSSRWQQCNNSSLDGSYAEWPDHWDRDRPVNSNGDPRDTF